MSTFTHLLLVGAAVVAALAGDVAPVPEYHHGPVIPAPPPPAPPCVPMMCAELWKPVCGCTCDGMHCRTFSSACHLRNYNCHNTPDFNFIRNGKCDECPIIDKPGPIKGHE